jgi:hypothetical protein
VWHVGEVAQVRERCARPQQRTQSDAQPVSATRPSTRESKRASNACRTARTTVSNQTLTL